MSQGSQDDTEKPFLEWLHHVECSNDLQDQLEAEDQDACIFIKASVALFDPKRGYCHIGA